MIHLEPPNHALNAWLRFGGLGLKESIILIMRGIFVVKELWRTFYIDEKGCILYATR